VIGEKSRELSEKIKEVIKKKELSQKEVALKAGVSEEQVSRLMNGKNEPLFVTIVKLAEALEIPMEALFNENIETSSLITSMMNNLPEDIAKK
jgi:transcriptional regulator with XRE-family HTH domain